MHRRKAHAIWRRRSENANASRTRLALISGDLLDQVDHTAPQLRVFDIREGLGQCEPIGAGQEFGDVVGNRGLRRAVLALLRGPGDTLKKERNRNLQDLGDVLQPAGANPVGSLFVFLDLLESQPQPFAELLLTLFPASAGAFAHGNRRICPWDLETFLPSSSLDQPQREVGTKMSGSETAKQGMVAPRQSTSQPRSPVIKAQRRFY